MIEPKDLRIGDLVQVIRDCAFPRGTLCAISEIHPKKTHEDKKGVVSLSYADGTDDGPWGEWCCNIEGIPLAPEILTKNGFKEEVLGDYYTTPIDNKKGFTLARFLSVERKRCDWAVFIKYHSLGDYALVRKIQYVHELQHILWALDKDSQLKI